ncbi:MAG: hypothetical protein WAW37_04730 [Syntrophobacteraceae bacterium]
MQIKLFLAPRRRRGARDAESFTYVPAVSGEKEKAAFHDNSKNLLRTFPLQGQMPK